MVVKIPSFSPAPSAQCVRLLFIKLCFGNSALFISSSGDREDPGASCLFSILIKLDPALWSWGDPKAFPQPEEFHFRKWNYVSFSRVCRSEMDSKVPVARHYDKIGGYTDEVQSFLIYVSASV